MGQTGQKQDKEEKGREHRAGEREREREMSGRQGRETEWQRHKRGCRRNKAQGRENRQRETDTETDKQTNRQTDTVRKRSSQFCCPARYRISSLRLCCRARAV